MLEKAIEIREKECDEAVLQWFNSLSNDDKNKFLEELDHMRYTLDWEDSRGKCHIELWREDSKTWRWFFRCVDIAYYQQSYAKTSLRSIKAFLRESFYPPHSVKFHSTLVACDEKKEFE